MTKTEKHKQLTREIILALKDLYTITVDFEDEGHGYFTFAVLQNNREWFFDLIRRDFEVMTHVRKGDPNFAEALQLEQDIQALITSIKCSQK